MMVAIGQVLDTARKNPYKHTENLETKTFSLDEEVLAIIAPWWTDCKMKKNVSHV